MQIMSVVEARAEPGSLGIYIFIEKERERDREAKSLTWNPVSPDIEKLFVMFSARQFSSSSAIFAHGKYTHTHVLHQYRFLMAGCLAD